NPNYANQLGHGRIDVLNAVVAAGTPVISTISPNTGKQGEDLQISITGQSTHFVQGTTQVSVDGATVQSVTVSNATSLTAQLTIAATAVLGSRTLTLTTGSEVVTLNNAFTVQAGTPVLTTVNPNSGRQGDAVTVTITGQFTGFVQ